MKTHLDWSAYDSYGMGDPYANVPATGGAYARAVAVCIGNGQCKRKGKGVMCPSFRVTDDEAHSTGARVRAFKAALNGELGPRPFHHPELAAAMELCIGCKGCKRECPNGVDMAMIKTEYLAQRNAESGVPLRARLFAHLPRLLQHRRLARALLALRNHWPWLARLGERWLGIAARRKLPLPAPRPYAAPAEEPTAQPGRQVLLFVDTFTHHFEPDVAEAAHAVLSAAGYQVRIARPALEDGEAERPLCCGRSYLSAGMVAQAQREARRVMAAFAPALEAGIPIVGLEPSCLLALRDEYYSLGLGPEVARLAKQVFLFEEFLLQEHNRKRFSLVLKSLHLPRALVHGHCHQKAFGGMKAVRKVLEWIPEFDFELIEASCCGMAGSFGVEAEHHDISLRMAEQDLLPALRAAPEAPVLADGFSCRQQIRDGAGRAPMHVAVLLRQALA